MWEFYLFTYFLPVVNQFNLQRKVCGFFFLFTVIVFFLVVILSLSVFELEETMPLQPQEYAKTCRTNLASKQLLLFWDIRIALFLFFTSKKEWEGIDGLEFKNVWLRVSSRRKMNFLSTIILLCHPKVPAHKILSYWGVHTLVYLAPNPTLLQQDLFIYTYHLDYTLELNH